MNPEAPGNQMKTFACAFRRFNVHIYLIIHVTELIIRSRGYCGMSQLIPLEPSVQGLRLSKFPSLSEGVNVAAACGVRSDLMRTMAQVPPSPGGRRWPSPNGLVPRAPPLSSAAHPGRSPPFRLGWTGSCRWALTPLIGSWFYFSPDPPLLPPEKQLDSCLLEWSGWL